MTAARTTSRARARLQAARAARVAPVPPHPRGRDHRAADPRDRRRARVTVRNFDSPLTVTYLLRDVAPILLIALPMTLIIITEEIDLSVASIVGLSSVMTGILTNAGWPFAARRARRDPRRRASAECVNGFLVTVVGLPSLAVTIGTLALFRGIAVGLLGTTAITDFPEFWTDLAKANIPGTPIPVIMIPFVDPRDRLRRAAALHARSAARSTRSA